MHLTCISFTEPMLQRLSHPLQLYTTQASWRTVVFSPSKPDLHLTTQQAVSPETWKKKIESINKVTEVLDKYVNKGMVQWLDSCFTCGRSGWVYTQLAKQKVLDKSVGMSVVRSSTYTIFNYSYAHTQLVNEWFQFHTPMYKRGHTPDHVAGLAANSIKARANTKLCKGQLNYAMC